MFPKNKVTITPDINDQKSGADRSQPHFMPSQIPKDM